MDKYRVKINPQAIRELDQIYEYIALAKLSPENAEGQTGRIKAAILDLDTFPQAHQERQEGRYAGKGYRQLLVDNYLAIFRIDEKKEGCHGRHYPVSGQKLLRMGCALCKDTNNAGTIKILAGLLVHINILF